MKLALKVVVCLCPRAEDCGWYETTDGRIALVATGAGLVLLVLVVSMTAFLCRRVKRRQAKGPM